MFIERLQYDKKIQSALQYERIPVVYTVFRMLFFFFKISMPISVYLR